MLIGLTYFITFWIVGGFSKKPAPRPEGYISSGLRSFKVPDTSQPKVETRLEKARRLDMEKRNSSVPRF